MLVHAALRERGQQERKSLPRKNATRNAVGETTEVPTATATAGAGAVLAQAVQPAAPANLASADEEQFDGEAWRAPSPYVATTEAATQAHRGKGALCRPFDRPERGSRRMETRTPWT